MSGFVIAHDIYGSDFLLNLDNVECFRSEKNGKCSAKLVSGYVLQLDSTLRDVKTCLDSMTTDKEEVG